MKKVIFLMIGLFFITHQNTFAQGKKQTIDNLMQMYHEYGQFNGTILVSEGGTIILKKGYGLANMEWNIQNKPDTKFRLGSVTKQFTSMLIMQLVEEGKIKLENRLTDYLPYYRKDTGDKISIHHLLTHTSGIPNYTDLPDFFEEVSRNPYSVDDFINEYCSGNLEFEPGSKYKYSNSGYFILGAIIEEITGESYENTLQKKIFDPLNMKNSGYDRHGMIIPKRATGYEKTMNGYINSPYLDMSIPFSAGSLYSTVEDLYLWDQALYTNKLLSEKYKKMMFTPFLHNYAYGWGIFNIGLGETKDSVRVVSHSGGINGFNTRIYRIVNDKHLIVLLNNTGSTNLMEMCKAITNILHNLPYEPPKLSVSDTLAEIVLKEDIENVIIQYYNLKTNQKDKYIFDENVLNQLGYQLLGVNRVPDAIEIFKLNVKEYPEAFNTYDSLGEAFMVNGDRELAIKNYAKSLELNPNNTNAIVMLLKINKLDSK